MTIRSVRLLSSLDQGLAVLEALAQAREEALGLTELAQRLALHKSTVARIVATLSARGYVEQDPRTRRYRLTLKLFELGSLCLARLELVTEARPIIEELAQASGEVVHLAVLDQGEVVYVDKVESEQTIRMYSRVGRRSPVHCTGVGKALLAFVDDATFQAIVAEKGLRRFTPRTITDADRLRDHLARVREVGVAFDDEEHEPGIRCVAAPVRDHRGVVIASISVAGPAVRMTHERLRELAEPVRRAAAAISARLGYRPNPGRLDHTRGGDLSER